MSAIQGMRPNTLGVWQWFRSHRFIFKDLSICGLAHCCVRRIRWSSWS